MKPAYPSRFAALAIVMTAVAAPSALFATSPQQAAEKLKVDDARMRQDPEPHEKACIAAAAERLPKVQGLTIKDAVVTETGINDVGIFSRFVTINVAAAGRDFAFVFACSKRIDTPPMIVPVGQK